MAGCKRCALKGGGGEREKENEKMGFKIVFFIYIYISVRMFFHMRNGHFSNI